MQVITGKFRGRRLISPDCSRPTLQRVKESLFSTIQGYINEATCLDLFAGSGALGIECISRNAKFVDFVEIESGAVKCLKQNLNKIDKAYYCIHNIDYKLALKKFENLGKQFDIIFLDPPYKSNTYLPAIEIIARYNLLKSGGIIVAEMDIENNLQFDIKEYIIDKIKEYGSLKIVFIKREN